MEKKIYGCRSQNIEEEINLCIRIAAHQINKKSQQRPWKMTLRRLMSKRCYEYFEDENDLISELDIEESGVTVVRNGNQTVIIFTLHSDLCRRKWFHKILKTFTIRCFLREVIGD